MTRKVTIETYDNAVRVVSMMRMCGSTMSFKQFMSLVRSEEGTLKSIIKFPLLLGSWGTSRFSYWRCERYLKSLKEVTCTVNVETPCEFCQYKKVCPDETKKGRGNEMDII